MRRYTLLQHSHCQLATEAQHGTAKSLSTYSCRQVRSSGTMGRSTAAGSLRASSRGISKFGNHLQLRRPPPPLLIWQHCLGIMWSTRSPSFWQTGKILVFSDLQNRSRSRHLGPTTGKTVSRLILSMICITQYSHPCCYQPELQSTEALNQWPVCFCT